MAKITLDPAMLHENGYPSTFIQNSSLNAGSGGYYRVGTGARWIFKGNPTKARIRVFNSFDPYTVVGTLPINNLCYRVNGLDYIAGNLAGGDEWYDLILPGHGTFTPEASWTKTIEIFVPALTVIGFGNPPSGGFPVEIEFNAPVTAVVPSATTTPHRVIWGDSVPAGGNAIMNPLQGFAGIMKRGTSDPFLEATSPIGVPRWKGVYSAGTLYAVDDVVSYSGSTWRKLTMAAAGTTPVIGTDWRIRGFIGKVTLVAYGARRVHDDCNGSTAQTAFATFIASLNPTELLINLGTNDDISNNSSSATCSPTQYQSELTGFLNALAGTSASAITVRCLTMLLTNGPGNIEGANNNGYTLDNYRTAMSNAAVAATKSNVTVVNGKTILTSTDFNDTYHPNNAGHQKLREALL